MHATSTIVISPASNSVTSLTRHSSFASPPRSVSLKTYRSRNKPRAFECSLSNLWTRFVPGFCRIEIRGLVVVVDDIDVARHIVMVLEHEGIAEI